MSADNNKKAVTDYRYDKTRKNNPPAGLAEYETRNQACESAGRKYGYDPYQSPQLVWAGKPGLKCVEVEDAAGVCPDSVALHVHEHVSAKAIIKLLEREEPQMELFATPKLPFHEAVKFYEHDVNWANRLILGDSLVVGNSLIEREMMAGKVQMIYMDPPYGVKYASNFQVKINDRQVKESDDHLTREPEQIKAYRDTWNLGIHSYLTYMRDRLRVCRDLLKDSGSVFVQISDENLHLVRCLMDEVFGIDNFVGMISFSTTGGQSSNLLSSVTDYIIWYSKNISMIKYHQLFFDKELREGGGWAHSSIELPNGKRIRPGVKEVKKILKKGEKVNPYSLDGLTSQGSSKSPKNDKFTFENKTYTPSLNSHWKTTLSGMKRLAQAGRIESSTNSIRYVRFLDDFPVQPITNIWTDTNQAGYIDKKLYVVQTITRVISRCIQMSTDPGDIVFDPTCGSGTTAFVAEQWGRRWITCDTSRVALSIARQRLLTATFPYYVIDDEKDSRNPARGFRYKTVPHITLKSIAQNTRIDDAANEFNPKIEAALKVLNDGLVPEYIKKPWQEWEVPFEPEAKWPADIKKLFDGFRKLKLDKQKEIDRIIAEDAPQEILYDQPETDNKIVRVSGPFTVEAIPPAVQGLESPVDGPDEDLDSFVPDASERTTDIVESEESHIANLVTLLQKDGVTFPDNKKMVFETLTARSGGVLHAEGTANERRVAVSFGPLHGPVTVLQVVDGLREASIGGYDDIIFCGFAFDPEAHATVSSNPNPRIRAYISHIRPDVLLRDAEGNSLLKTTASSQLFTVFGEPDIDVRKKDGEYTVHLLGVDVYDPVDGVVISENAGRVAAWFVDTDYNGQTFCIHQAFFPDKSAWNKIERALKGTLDKDRFELLTGQESLPFRPGKYKKIAVKVVDPRGNEVMKIVRL